MDKITLHGPCPTGNPWRYIAEGDRVAYRLEVPCERVRSGILVATVFFDPLARAWAWRVDFYHTYGGRQGCSDPLVTKVESVHSTFNTSWWAVLAASGFIRDYLED